MPVSADLVSAARSLHDAGYGSEARADGVRFADPLH